MQRKIQRSNQQNQARLAVLKARDDNVDSVLQEAAKKLGEITQDERKYQDIISSLIAQGLFQLIEPKVSFGRELLKYYIFYDILSKMSVGVEAVP